MYGSESWTIKKAEHWSIDYFELWCWERLLRVPRTARRSNLSIPKKSTLSIHQNDWCWSWSSNTLKTLILGKIEGKRRRRWQRMRWLNNITNLTDMKLGKIWEIVRDWKAWCIAVHGIAKSQTQLRFSSVQSLSHVWLFETPWTATCQPSLSFTIYQSLLTLMSIESVMLPNHLILWHLLLLLPSIFPSIRVFFNESALCIR